MRCDRINFYDQFHCPAGDCHLNCCKGWRVPIDEETLERYKKMPAKQRALALSRITKKEDTYVFRFREKGCSYWTKEGLCGFQKEGHMEHMPLVCRVFPRKQNDYGIFMEETFYLSCPYAAKLFLQYRKELALHPGEGELQSGAFTTNDDLDFLRELQRIRGELLQFIEDSSHLEDAYGRMLEWANRTQNACIRAQSIPSIFDINAQKLDIDGLMTDRMITGGFYHTRLKKNSPGLYALLDRYFKEMNDLTIEEAGKRQSDIKRVFYEANVEYCDLAKRYYQYYLLSSFLEVYDTYCFHRVLAEGIIHTHLLELFLGIRCLEKFDEKREYVLMEDEIADVIALYERRGRHNPPILDNNYQILYEATSKKA